MENSKLIILGIIILSFIIGIYLYPQLPSPVASHWNFRGEVNGYMSKFWGLFLMPLISIFILLLFLLIPRIDPLKANIEKFRKHFDRFLVLFILFLFYIYLLTIFWNLGQRFSINLFLIPAFAILFYYTGILIENAKRNWFVGIRTPWTLSSETVWEKTHKIGGKLMKAAAIFILFGVFFPDYLWFFILFPILFATLYPAIYSYFEYQAETKNGA